MGSRSKQKALLIGLSRKFDKFIESILPSSRGSVDELSLRCAQGWAIVGDGSEPAQIAVIVAGQVVAIATANGIRNDVKAAGHRTEVCGFSIELDLSPRDLLGNNVRVAFWSGTKVRADLPINSDARPWSLGFWDQSGQPVIERWRSLAARIKLERDLLPVVAASRVPEKTLLFEGPLRGDYSIAIVNRNFAKAVLQKKANVTLTSKNERLDDDPFFNAEKDLVDRYKESPLSADFDVHSLNTWPPETGLMASRFKTLHCYAWEESSFPPKFLAAFNSDLDLVCVTSKFTQIALQNSGLTVPTAVVGNGIDKELFNLRRRKRRAKDRFRFLHISSCFARKAADKLVQAFVEEFYGENVELHIKTFDNPHNNIREIISSYGDRAKNITSNFANLSQLEIRQLYLKSDCLVAASRGEGFLLPAAEAMAVGLPVITTDAGGQADFCDNTTAWLVKSTAVASETHMSLSGSYWYEPDLQSLRRQMRLVYEATDQELEVKTSPARELVRNTYAWDKVAARYLAALERKDIKSPGRPKLAIVTTWNQSCGIATYSEELVPHLEKDFEVNVISELAEKLTGVDQDFVRRQWRRRSDSMPPLADAVIDGGLDAVLIQHHPSHVGWADLGYLIDCIVQGGNGRIKVFCQLHSTAGQSSSIQGARLSLARTEGIFVHTLADVEALGPIAADTRVAVIPHGIPKIADDLRRQKDSSAKFHIGSFGFCMPHKGIMNHLRSIAIIREKIPDIKVTLLHAVNDDQKTVFHALEIMQLIRQLSLDDVVDIDFRFLSKKEVSSRLSSCDLLVLPYDNNLESASGAIRDVLGISVPILTTDISTFSDVSDFVFKVTNNHPLNLASKILQLYSEPSKRVSKLEDQIAYVDGISWEKIGSRMSGIMRSVL
ncbi:glycosyltransferase [Neorhizobium lilium]|uniref:Glycosyltransferase n=1 Tax=Neorhizobium lilium TaxID=2503024 RepID=A0A3S3TZY6_9HYPH|nr:glycosyltransferase [Neorhizobium lilium]RWX78758.1 glycosyltransferase [Neorhizobium lilium]